MYKFHAVIVQLSLFPPNPWDKHTDHSNKVYTVHHNNANFFLKRGVFFDISFEGSEKKQDQYCLMPL